MQQQDLKNMNDIAGDLIERLEPLIESITGVVAVREECPLCGSSYIQIQSVDQPSTSSSSSYQKIGENKYNESLRRFTRFCRSKTFCYICLLFVCNVTNDHPLHVRSL